jgi:hypothetical protein
MGEGRNVYRVLVGKRPLERPRHRWEDVDWITWLRIGTIGGLL